ncbi:protein FAM107B [Callorhinchus milii]|uniref:Zgc:195245 n=1 Tax=Callorhinchus milii TaxID=7868 RepID=A0A4W3GY71_CALMI|nr:protein FAM107B [Callorhinchus milii]|eukprot:gi/632953481/ref/XP_007892441.1/ PREDICTED: protein FAM107B-like isoform X1 [Callorhinchus milii]
MGGSQGKKSGCSSMRDGTRSGYAWAGERGAGTELDRGAMAHSNDNTELIKPRKLNNPVKDSKNYQELHRELLLSQKRGSVLQNKPELQRVMEQRKYDLQKEREEAQRPKSDFEQELKKRHQILEQYEQEQQKTEEQENVPEFVKVKESLRRTKLTSDAEDSRVS